MSAVISPPCKFTAMTVAHLDEVVLAENRIHPFPWTRGQFQDSITAGHELWLMQEGQLLAGYAVTMRVVDEMHLLTIGVLPELQRQGRGNRLLEYLLHRAQQQDLARMLLEVRTGNLAALALSARHGFHEIGRRKDYYAGHQEREDAVVMVREL